MVACSDFTQPPLHIQGMIQLPLSATKKLYRNNNHSRADHRIDHEFADRSVATGNAEFHQQIRQTDVFHRQELSCSCHAQCTGQIGLAAVGSPRQDHIVVLMDVVAGPEAEQFFLLQLPVWQILHILQTSCRVGEGCLPDQALQMVALSCIPFCVNNKPQSVLNAQNAHRSTGYTSGAPAAYIPGPCCTG